MMSVRGSHDQPSPCTEEYALDGGWSLHHAARMSKSPSLRRAEKLLPEDACWRFIENAYCGRVASVSADGEPYITPLLYVVIDGDIWVHTTAATGHLRTNLDAGASVCFECDEPGAVYAYGRFQCDTGLEYTSVVAFGRLQPIDDRVAKARFFDAFMAKYSPDTLGRAASFYPRLDLVTVFRFAMDRMTGKRTVLPAAEDRWPARDRTMTPSAVAPDAAHKLA